MHMFYQTKNILYLRCRQTKSILYLPWYPCALHMVGQGDVVGPHVELPLPEVHSQVALK